MLDYHNYFSSIPLRYHFDECYNDLHQFLSLFSLYHVASSTEQLFYLDSNIAYPLNVLNYLGGLTT